MDFGGKRIKNYYYFETFPSIICIKLNGSEENGKDYFIIPEIIDLKKHLENSKNKQKDYQKDYQYNLTGEINYSKKGFIVEENTSFCWCSRNNNWYCFRNEKVTLSSYQEDISAGKSCLLFYHITNF